MVLVSGCAKTPSESYFVIYQLPSRDAISSEFNRRLYNYFDEPHETLAKNDRSGSEIRPPNSISITVNSLRRALEDEGILLTPETEIIPLPPNGSVQITTTQAVHLRLQQHLVVLAQDDRAPNSAAQTTGSPSSGL